MVANRQLLFRIPSYFLNQTQIAAKSSAFVESTNLVKSRAVKSAPKYPSFVSKQKGNKMSQKYEFVLVLDFEATCQENSKGPLLPVQEIIEFPVVQLSTKDWKEVRRFHKYIRPTESPRITSFCTSLTGIIQEMVDNQSTLSKVLVEFDTWMKEDSRLQSENFAFVTCGDWDLKVALPNEANFKKIPIPDYFNQWINVKKAYSEHTNQFARGMAQLLQIFKIQHQGRLHSGIDDVANICEIVRCLGQDGHNYRITSSNVPNATTRRFFRDTANKK